jgi:hypothetical protein
VSHLGALIGQDTDYDFLPDDFAADFPPTSPGSIHAKLYQKFFSGAVYIPPEHDKLSPPFHISFSKGVAMTLRTTAARIVREARPRPGAMITSGVTAQPKLSAAFLVVADQHASEFARALRFHAVPHRVAIASEAGVTATVFNVSDRDEAEAAVMMAAHRVIRGTDAPARFLNSPARWPAILKRLAK